MLTNTEIDALDDMISDAFNGISPTQRRSQTKLLDKAPALIADWRAMNARCEALQGIMLKIASGTYDARTISSTAIIGVT